MVWLSALCTFINHSQTSHSVCVLCYFSLQNSIHITCMDNKSLKPITGDLFLSVTPPLSGNRSELNHSGCIFLNFSTLCGNSQRDQQIHHLFHSVCTAGNQIDCATVSAHPHHFTFYQRKVIALELQHTNNNCTTSFWVIVEVLESGCDQGL